MSSTISRRTALTGAAALAVAPATLMALPAAPIKDPLLDLVQKCRAGFAQYNELSRGADEDDLSRIAEETYEPPLYALWNNPPAATSAAGVTAALRLLLDEGDLGRNNEAIVRAALTFLDKA